MVGHTGILDGGDRGGRGGRRAASARCWRRSSDAGGAMIVTADHGNCEQMVDPVTGGPHTAHTLNPVPVILVGGPGRRVAPRRAARRPRAEPARPHGRRAARRDDRNEPDRPVPDRPVIVRRSLLVVIVALVGWAPAALAAADAATAARPMPLCGPPPRSARRARRRGGDGARRGRARAGRPRGARRRGLGLRRGGRRARGRGGGGRPAGARALRRLRRAAHGDHAAPRRARGDQPGAGAPARHPPGRAARRGAGGGATPISWSRVGARSASRPSRSGAPAGPADEDHRHRVQRVRGVRPAGHRDRPSPRSCRGRR